MLFRIKLELIDLDNGRYWLASMNGNVLGEIHLDYINQVDEVVLSPGIVENVQTQILRLATSHAAQFVIDRRYSNGIFSIVSRDNNLSRYDSPCFMNFESIPDDINEMDKDTLLEQLERMGIAVIFAKYTSAMVTLNAVVNAIGVESLSWKIVENNLIFHTHARVIFAVEEPNSLTTWKSLSKPGEGFNLNIVPPYHPVMDNRTSVGLINGATDAYIRGNSIKSIYCPTDAVPSSGGRGFGSWLHVNHPYKAEGQSIVIDISTTFIRGEPGVLRLTELLQGLLGLDNKYISVSGGFNAPLRCPHNRLIDKGQSRSRKPRGSEAHCVWSYRILTQEGLLEQSYTPPWFLTERWLEVYEGAEVRHGLY